MKKAITEQRRVVFTDEMLITSSTVATHEWSPLKVQNEMADKALVMEPVRLILGISAEKEVEACAFVDSHFDRYNSM